MMKSTPLAEKRRTRGPGRTSREDWLRTALDLLVSDGVDAIKVAALSERLGCARSSFYWYFKNRDDLLGVLLDEWQNLNTRTVVSYAAQPADTVNLALVTLFEGLLDAEKFDTRLDFAVREWARRDVSIRRAVDISDDARLDAISAMFTRYGFEPVEAAIRARIVYFTQIGYEALDTRNRRMDREVTGRHYLFCLTGQKPDHMEIEAINALAIKLKVQSNTV